MSSFSFFKEVTTGKAHIFLSICLLFVVVVVLSLGVSRQKWSEDRFL